MTPKALEEQDSEPTQIRIASGQTAYRVFSVCAFSSAIGYLRWRLTESTFNPDSPWISILFFIAELNTFFSFSFFIVMGWKRIERISAGLDTLTQKIPTSAWPKVDVYITSLNEPISLVEGCLKNALQLEYPSHLFKVFVLDDGGRSALKAICEKFGDQCVYISRVLDQVKLVGAKAGNLNYALSSRRCQGEFILLLDCDHFVKPRALLDLLPHFYENNPKAPEKWDTQNSVGFVQAPDCSWSFRAGNPLADDLKAFFDCFAKSFDAWGAVNLVGTSSLIRTQSLRAVGGFYTEAVTEDWATGLRLYANGWRGKFHSKAISKGIPPINVSAMLRQRQRWMTGEIQGFFRLRKELLPSLPLFPKLLFLSGPALLVLRLLSQPIFLLLHPIGVFLGTPPIIANPIQFAIVFVPYIVFLKIQAVLFFRDTTPRSFLRSEQIYYCTLPAVYAALWKTYKLRLKKEKGKPLNYLRKNQFWISPKKNMTQSNNVDLLSLCILVVGILIFASFIYCIYLIFHAKSFDAKMGIIPALVWQLHYLICLSPVLFYLWRLPREGHDTEITEPQVLSSTNSSVFQFLCQPNLLAPVVTVGIQIYILLKSGYIFRIWRSISGTF